MAADFVVAWKLPLDVQVGMHAANPREIDRNDVSNSVMWRWDAAGRRGQKG